VTWDLSGAFGGAGDTTGSITFQGILSGLLAGTGDVSSLDAVRVFLVGGRTEGVGDIRLDTETAFSGLLDGTGDLSADTQQVLAISGMFWGYGDVVESAPLPFYGFGDLVGYADVRQWPAPLCSPAAVPSFRWNAEFDRCGLSLNLCDARGLPYSPVTVLYAMYQVMPGGYRLLRGQPNRKPVTEGVGSYYATGTAGECGQPGDWVIVWRWQRDPFSPVETREMSFRVVDTANCPCDTLPRMRKYGWNC
jgi:hypothetical protein